MSVTGDVSQTSDRATRIQLNLRNSKLVAEMRQSTHSEIFAVEGCSPVTNFAPPLLQRSPSYKITPSFGACFTL